MSSAAPAGLSVAREPASRDCRHITAIAAGSLIVLALVACIWRYVPPATAPRINVRWAPGVADEARLAAQREFKLLRGEVKDGRTWAYDLGNISRANVQALVAHPAVEDTHYINRSAGTIWPTAPRGTVVIGGALNRVRDSAVLTWASTASAMTIVVSVLWLVTTGRRGGRP
jgi:hypothetical protein